MRRPGEDIPGAPRRQEKPQGGGVFAERVNRRSAYVRVSGVHGSAPDSVRAGGQYRRSVGTLERELLGAEVRERKQVTSVGSVIFQRSSVSQGRPLTPLFTRLESSVLGYRSPPLKITHSYHASVNP